MNIKKNKLQWKDDLKNGGRSWCKNVTNHNKQAIRWKERVKASERVKCECYHCRQDADNEVFMELVKWQQEFNAWEQEDIFFEQCLSTTKKEFISLTKWKAGQVGCFCREHCEARLRICREGKKMDQEELWKLNKMNARKRCAPVR